MPEQLDYTDPQAVPQAQQPPKQNDQVSLEDFEEMARQKYGVPKNLVKAMTQQESGGQPDNGWGATSATGVKGKYQVTEATAKQYGLDRNDPFQQTVAAMKHLRNQYDALGNIKDENARWLSAVGRYYGGGGAVDDQGRISTDSPDGVSNPLNHMKRVANNWKALGLDGNGDGIPDSQQQAQPAQQTASQAKKVKPSMKSQPAPDLIQQATGGNAASNLISSAIKNNPLGNTLYSAPAGPLVNNQPVQQFTPKQQAQATQEWENSRNQVKPVTREELRQVRAQKAVERVRRQVMSDAMPVSPVNPLGSLPVSAAIPFAQTTASTVIPAVANVLKATGASVPDSAVNPIAQGLRALGSTGNAIRSDYQERAANIQEARESLPDDPLNKAAQLGGEIAGTVVPFGVAEMTGGPAAAHALNVASQDWSNPRQATRNALVNSALMATGNAAGRISGDIGQQVANRTGSDFLGTATNVAGRTGANALLAPALTGAANALDGKPNTTDELTQQALMGAAFANLSNPSVRAQRARVGYVKDLQGNGTDIVPINVAEAANRDAAIRQQREATPDIQSVAANAQPVATVTTPEAPQTQPAAAGVKAPTPIKNGSLGRNLLGSVGAEEAGPMEHLLNNSAPVNSSAQGVNVNQEATNRPNAKPVQESAPFTKAEQSAPVEQGGVEILSPDSIPAYEKGKRITKMTIAGQDVLVRIPKGMHPEEAQIRAELQLRQGKGAGNDVPGSPVVQSEAGNPAAPAAQETDATLQAKTPEEAPASLPARPVEPAPESTRGNVAANETAETAPTEIKPAEATLPVSKEVQSNAPEQRGVMGSPEAERVTGEKPVAPVAEAGASPRAETGASEEAPANVSRSSDIYRTKGAKVDEAVLDKIDERAARREGAEKGENGQISYWARRSFPIEGTDQKTTALGLHPKFRDYLNRQLQGKGEGGIPPVPSVEGLSPQEKNTVLEAAAHHTMDAVATVMGKERSSQITPEDWHAFEYKHGPRLPDDVKLSIAKTVAAGEADMLFRRGGGVEHPDVQALITRLREQELLTDAGAARNKKTEVLNGFRDTAQKLGLSREAGADLGRAYLDWLKSGVSKGEDAAAPRPDEPQDSAVSPEEGSRRATASERVTPSESGRGDAEASVPSDRGVSAERAGQERTAQSGEPRTNEADNQKRQDNVKRDSIPNPLDDEAFYEQQRRNQRKAQGEKRDSGYSTLPNDVASLINKAVKGATGKDISQIVDHFKTHADNFVAWGKAVMNDLGQSIRPKLKEIWDGLHKFVTDEKGTLDLSRLKEITGFQSNADYEAAQAARVTGTSAFKRWFGNSKVVDDSGKPLIVYHGTPSGGFDRFEDGRGRQLDSGWLAKGYYFTDSPQAADYYASRSTDKEARAVYPVYLQLKNPFHWGAKTPGVRDLVNLGKPLPNEIHDEVVKRSGFKFNPNTEPDYLNEPLLSSNITRVLQEKGYDGVIADVGNGKKEYVIFDPTQVKSATGNRGTFDPTDANISHDLGSAAAEAVKRVYRGAKSFISNERGSITADGSKLPSQEELTKQAKGHEKIGLPADFDIRKYAKEADKILADSKIPDEKLNKAKDIFQRSIDAVNSGDGAALAKAQVELKDLLKNTTWVKAADFMRPLNATGEFSPVGRQGWIGWLTHPKDSLNAFRAATGSDEKAMEFLARQLAKPGMPLMKAAGLDLGMLNEINLSKSALSREENTTSRWPEKIPIAGKALGYIERFNKTFLEGQRINLFETYQKAAESRGAQMWEIGKDGKMVPSKAAKEIAKQINIISGRGDIPDNKIAQAVVDLGSVVAYSPRFAISRFQAADPSRLYRVYKQSPEVFKSVATDYVKQLAAYTALAGALKVAGFQVNVTDPDDPDFLKAKIGNFRVPIVQGGLQPAVRFAAKMVKRGYEISSGKGDKGRSGAVTKAGSDVQSFLRQKEAPMAGFLHDQVLARKDYTDSVTQDKVNMGTNAIGQPVSAGRDFAQHILPMYFLQTIESYQNGGPAVGAATGGMELFGLSSGYYDSGKYGESQADGMGKARLKRDWSYAQSGYAPWNEGMEPLDKYHARVQRADKLYNDSLPALRETSYYQNADKATQRKMEETLTRRIADLSYEETPSVSKIAPSSIIGSEQTSEKRLKSNTKKRANRAW